MNAVAENFDLAHYIFEIVGVFVVMWGVSRFIKFIG